MATSNVKCAIEVLDESADDESSDSVFDDSSNHKRMALPAEQVDRSGGSTLRSFLCCGSELSLVSHTEVLPMSPPTNPGVTGLNINPFNSNIGCHLFSETCAKQRRKIIRGASSTPPCLCESIFMACRNPTGMTPETTTFTMISGTPKVHSSKVSNQRKVKRKKFHKISKAVKKQACSRRFDRLDDIHSSPPGPHVVCHGRALLNRQVVDRLSSSFRRGCELSESTQTVYQEIASLPNPSLNAYRRSPLTVHTQVDYIHHLVPDLLEVCNRSYYWGVMDRYEAEKLLENKPEGTFLLRDSAQDDFLFSVSFRRYGRTLHARIEQWKHKFSFDSHDPSVFATHSVCSLIEHYKDADSCMFFEPMLTQPLHRSFPFSLQHLCRAVVCSHVTYDTINFLPIPYKIKECLKYYHYKQKVRVRRLDSTDEVQ